MILDQFFGNLTHIRARHSPNPPPQWRPTCGLLLKLVLGRALVEEGLGELVVEEVDLAAYGVHGEAEQIEEGALPGKKTDSGSDDSSECTRDVGQGVDRRPFYPKFSLCSCCRN